TTSTSYRRAHSIGHASPWRCVSARGSRCAARGTIDHFPSRPAACRALAGVAGTHAPGSGAERTDMTVIRTLRYGKGYSGRLGNRCWAARITGTDNTYGLAREFLEPVSVEREHFNRPRTIVHFSYELEVDGLYEL